MGQTSYHTTHNPPKALARLLSFPYHPQKSTPLPDPPPSRHRPANESPPTPLARNNKKHKSAFTKKNACVSVSASQSPYTYLQAESRRRGESNKHHLEGGHAEAQLVCVHRPAVLLKRVLLVNGRHRRRHARQHVKDGVVPCTTALSNQAGRGRGRAGQAAQKLCQATRHRC